MVALIRTQRKTAQPKFTAAIDRTNPITNKLLVSSNTACERLFSAAYTKATAHGIITVDPGTANTGGQNVDTGLVTLPSSGGMSLGWSGVVLPRTTGAGTCGIKFRLNYNINSLYHFINLNYYDTGGGVYAPQFNCGISFTDFTNVAAPGPDFFTSTNLLMTDMPVGSRYSVMMTVEDNAVGGIKLYLNGILKTSNTTPAGKSYDGGANWMLNDGSGEFPQLCAFAWGRTLSPTEVMSMHNNPWQIFNPGV